MDRAAAKIQASWRARQLRREAHYSAQRREARIYSRTPAGQGDAASAVGVRSAWSTQELKYLPIRRLVCVDDAQGLVEISPSISSWNRYTISASGASDEEISALGGSRTTNDLYSISLRSSTATLVETCGNVPPLRIGQVSVAYRNYLLVWGGAGRGMAPDFDGRMYMLECGTREWSVPQVSRGEVPAGRHNHTLMVCGEKLVLFSGRTATYWLNDTWDVNLEPLQSPAFHPNSWVPTWTRWPVDKRFPRGENTSISFKGKIYMFGRDGEDSPSELWVCDISDRSWRRLETGGAPWKVGNPRAAIVQNVMYIHGWVDWRPTVIVFRFSDRKWFKLGTVPGKERLSQLGFHPNSTKVILLDGSACYMMDPGLVDFPEVEIRLSEDDVRLRWVELLKPSPINTSGGSCDLFMGTYHPSGLKFAMKRPRGIEGQTEVFKRLLREAQMWSTLKHPNILPFFGALNIDGHLHLVAAWIELGDLSRFIKKRSQYLKDFTKDASTSNENLDRIYSLYHRFNEIRCVHQIAAGIEYLQSIDIVHGDLKGPNVLISDNCAALICDFGLTKISGATTSLDLKGYGSLRWQSPELFDNHPKTFKSDIYAFAMVIVEIVTGDYPYPEALGVSAVLKKVTSGARPKFEPMERSGVRFEGLWDLAAQCWAEEPDNRLSIGEVMAFLNAELLQAVIV